MGHKMSKIGQNNIARQVADYIELHPVVKNALQRGIVNYSSLVREIQKNLGLEKNFEAVLIAVRRNATKLMKTSINLAEKVSKVLSQSNMEIKTKRAVIMIEKNQRALNMVHSIISKIKADAGYLDLIEGSDSVSVILEEKLVSEFKKLQPDILRINKDQIEIVIRSPEDIEDVPGVIAFVTNAFAERGINIQEILSCYKETILLFDKKDINEVVEVMNKLTK
jgi:hypothetical protein